MITVDGSKMPWQEGMRVSDLLRKIDAGRQIAVVRLNDRTVSKPDFDAVYIPNEADIFLIPMIAGG